MSKNIRSHYLFTCLQVLFVLAWMFVLRNTSSYFINYVICGMLAVVSMMNHQVRAMKTSYLFILFSLLFSLVVLLCNYDLFTYSLRSLVKLFLVLSGGYIVGRNILCLLFVTKPQQATIRKSTRTEIFVFLIPFLLYSGIYLLYLFFTAYPGYLTPDSISQVLQTQTGVYSNHHPFWHTIIIKWILDAGVACFGNLNDAVGLYSVLQILFLTSAVSFSLMTLYQAGIKKRYLVLCGLPFAVLPYHFAYSVTMWKDIVFGAAALWMVTFLFRELHKIGKMNWNQFFLFVVTLAFCLWRSNAWIAMVVSVVFFFVYLRKEEKTLPFLLLAAVCFAWVLKGPVLNAFNVIQPDFAESLSIPIQQISRVIVESGDLTKEEYELIDKVIDINEVYELYTPHVSDPMKDEVRGKNPNYLEEHKLEYLLLWAKAGLKNPEAYIKAWIDQTKGYLNSGYEYWIYLDYVFENDLGIEKIPQENIIQKCFSVVFNLIQSSTFYLPFISIGLWGWVICAFAVVLFSQKRRETILYIPFLLIICTLLIATPVFSEFRYAYSIFTTLPFLSVIGLFKFDE